MQKNLWNPLDVPISACMIEHMALATRLKVEQVSVRPNRKNQDVFKWLRRKVRKGAFVSDIVVDALRAAMAAEEQSK